MATLKKKKHMPTTKRSADAKSTDQWGETETGKPPLPPRSQKEAAAANRLADQWSKVSAVVSQARQSPEPTTVNQLLADQAKDDPNGPLTPAYTAWAADNLMIEARFDEAIEIYRDIATRYDGHSLTATSLWPHVFEQRAACHERLGKPERRPCPSTRN